MTGARDQKSAQGGGKSEGEADEPGNAHRALIMQLIQRANRWNGSHGELVAEFAKLAGGVDAGSSVAIMKWQRAHGLKADGCVGPQTVETARKGAGAADGGKEPDKEPAKEQAKEQAASPAAATAEQATPAGAAEPADAKAAEPTAKPADGKPAPAHPMAAKAGHSAGKFVGEVVTEGLALLPSWNKPVVDANGKPVESVPGAERVGDHDIEKRHQEVVGPEITALAERIPAGILHDFIAGFGDGATEAPGDSYRNEAALADKL